MRGVGTDQPRSPISRGHCWHQEMPLGTLWVGSKQRSSRTLTAQHQALLGCLPHRLFVSLAQVNQLLDALLGLQEKGQGDEVWLSGLEQEHSQMGRAAQGTAAPWCRKAPHPLSSLLFFFPALPPPAATAHLGHSQLFSPRSRRLCRCVQSHQPRVSSSSGTCSPPASSPHPSPSSSPAPHTLPHVSAPPHPPAAPGSTQGPGGDGGVSATILSRAGGSTPGAVAPAHLVLGLPSTYPLAEAGVFRQAAELG